MTGCATNRSPSERTACAAAARITRASAARHSGPGGRETYDDFVAFLEVLRPDRGEVSVRDQRSDGYGLQLPTRVRDLDVESPCASRGARSPGTRPAWATTS